MKTIANRLIVFAASAIAFGTVAFGQSRMTAEIPFAFHTVSGSLPAGTYEIRETQLGGNAHVVFLRNTVTHKGTLAGTPVYNEYRKSASGAVVEFVCDGRNCSLSAIRTVSSSLEYATPHKSKDGEKMAVVAVAIKPAIAD